MSHVWGYAATAGAIDTLPVAGALAVPVVQGKMLHSLAGILGVTWTRTTLAEFSGCLGAGALLRFGAQFGVRQLVKLVPGYGTLIGEPPPVSQALPRHTGWGMPPCCT